MKRLLGIITGVILLGSYLHVANAAEKHLFYMHGCCIKDINDPKVKVYESIVEGLKKSGFDVAYELRTADIGDSDEGAHAHARAIANQVKELLVKGTPPQDITVAGFSLGSMTALVTSSLINNPEVNFVLLAGCPVKPSIPVTIDYSKVNGRILSIRATGDTKFGSCDGKFPQGVTYKEIVVNNGKGHAEFKMADEAHVKQWRDPLIAWSEKR